MSLDVRTRAADGGYRATIRPLADTIRARANWGERIVTVLATSIAILVVALIAVLMGMT